MILSPLMRAFSLAEMEELHAASVAVRILLRLNLRMIDNNTGSPHLGVLGLWKPSLLGNPTAVKFFVTLAFEVGMLSLSHSQNLHA